MHFPESVYKTPSRAGLRCSSGPRRDGLRVLAGSFASIFLVLAGLQSTDASPTAGDMSIEQRALDSTIRLETSARFAGSVASIVFRGKQFVDVHDHGRELQSASSFDGFGECFNPTEAGSLVDDVKETTSSKLLTAKSGPNWIETKTDMAFWLPPNYDYVHQCGQSPGTTHAVNKTITGGHILDKRIQLGEGGIANVIGDHVTYTVPEAHRSGTFEAATIYTPSDFSRRYVLNFGTGNVEPTSVFGEQEYPVILATADGKYAVGVFSPWQPQRPGHGYGTFTFPNTNKLNCVYRENSIAAGQKFNYLCELVVGTLDEVKATILVLHSRAAH
jgi:hypothetical protein